MTVLAVTGATAVWILGKANLLDAIHESLLGGDSSVNELRGGNFAETPVRLSAADDLSLIAFWNVDYATGAGDDTWGFIDLSAETGLASKPGVSRESLERALYVVGQRSQGLLIDGAFIHRAHANGAHTCMAGRGTDARHLSIGYVEHSVYDDSRSFHAVAITGPEWDIGAVAAKAAALEYRLAVYLTTARAIYGGTVPKPLLPQTAFRRLREVLAGLRERPSSESEYSSVSVATKATEIRVAETYRTASWTYADWLSPESPLSHEQRRLLDEGAILRHPVRIAGPAGSGKTLLMQLLAIWRLRAAARKAESLRVLYLVHNQKMAEMVQHRFEVLFQSEANLRSVNLDLETLTLSEYARRELALETDQVVDSDAQAAKEFQLEMLRSAVTDVFGASEREVEESRLFAEVSRNPDLEPVFDRMLMAEISVAIKGHGLQSDAKRYIESERPLSRMHGMLSQDERRVVFDIFRSYHETMFEGFNVLDSDDVALSLLGRLRTPIWQLKRRDLGYDHVFVDEAQLFNENELRLFALLTKTNAPFVPAVLALDEAQEIHGQTTAGLATLGIENVASENLTSVHRSTAAIIRLAFFIIQQTTDLFGPEFPDFTSLVTAPGDEVGGPVPSLETIPEAQPSYGRFVLNTIRSLRKANLWRVAVICMAEQYWLPLLEELRDSSLPLHVLEHRGERLPMTEPVVVLSRPAHIGGQEFDAVLIVGAEEGLTPPHVVGNEALASAVEQQALREFYLSITRARREVRILLARGAAPSPVLSQALKAGLLLPG